MRLPRTLSAICAIFLGFSTHLAGQSRLSPILSSLPLLSGGGGTVGPDGTFYALVPASGSTLSMPAWDLKAVEVSPTPGTKWTASLTGDLGSVLPGLNTVFVVQTVVSGSGRTATSTTSIVLLSAADGTQSQIISPSGIISDIQVKTIGSSDYLYVQTISTSTSQSGGTTTTATSRTLTVYSQAGAVLATVAL